MSARRDASSDRLTVIALVVLCLLLLIVPCGLALFLFAGASSAFDWIAGDQGHGIPASTPAPTVGGPDLPEPAATATGKPGTPPPTPVAIGGTPSPPAGGGDRFTEPRAYVCAYDSKAVFVYDARTGASRGFIDLSHDPSGVAVSHDGKYVYVNDGDNITVADAKTNQVIGSIRIDNPTTGYLAVSPDDSHLFAVCDQGMYTSLSIVELNGRTGNVTSLMGAIPAMGIGVTPSGSHVLTTYWSKCWLMAIDMTTPEHYVTGINLAIDSKPEGFVDWEGVDVRAAGQAVGLAISPDGRHAVVGIWAGSFMPVVDLQEMKLEKTVPLDGRSYQCAAYSPDGQQIYLSHYDGNRILIMDGSTYEVISTIPVASSPKNIAVTPDGRYLYVAHENTNVEIIDLSKGIVIRTLDCRASKDGTNIAFNPAVA